MRKIIIIGPMGYGKSTTGNNLLKGDYFTTGEDVQCITMEIKFKEIDDLLVVDCPGFGDPMDYTLFHTEFLKHKKEFLEASPVNAFILVVKFDKDKSEAFLDAAKQFYRSFGSIGIKSLMILCIQGNEKIRYCHDDFVKIILGSEGYEFLKDRLKEDDESYKIPYCLWDNHRPYFNQERTLDKILDNLQQYTRQMMRLAIERMQREVERHNS